VREQRYRERNPEKVRARKALSHAISSGKIVRGPCVICGEPKTQGHHPDYGQPLRVVWLCFRHHRLIDGRLIVGPKEESTNPDKVA
jgi:hypothetical protein